MTSAESVELLFRLNVQGQPEAERLAGVIQNVGTAGTAAAANLTSLESAITALTTATLANTAALDAMAGTTGAGGLAGITRGTTAAVGGTRALTNEMRVLEGAMPIRAAAAFLAQIGPLNAALQALFPIFGAIALVGVLDTILTKAGLMPSQWNATTEAQKKSYEELDKQGKKQDELLHKLKQYQIQIASGGDPTKLKQLEAASLRGDAADLQSTIDTLKAEIAVVEKLAAVRQGGSVRVSGKGLVPHSGVSAPLGLSEQYLAGMAGMTAPFDPSQTDAYSIEEAKTLLPNLRSDLRTANIQQQTDAAKSKSDDVNAKHELSQKAAEEALKRQHEDTAALKEAESYLRRETEFRATALEKINIEYGHELEKAKAIRDVKMRPEAVSDVTRGHDVALTNLGREEGEKFEKDWNAMLIREAEAWRRATEEADKELQEIGKQLEENDARLASVMGRVQDDATSAAATGLTRQVGADARARSRNPLISPQVAAGQNYQESISAAQQLLTIETRRLNVRKLDADLADIMAGKEVFLTEQEAKDIDRLADLRKRAADEVFQAEEKYENALADMREKDLHKYQEMAGGLFDALHNHSVGPWFRNFALGQTKSVFENVTGPLLQGAGHAIGGLIPNINIPGIGNPLRGTIFDSANADPAKRTADNTLETAKQVKALRGDIRKLAGAPEVPDSADGGSGITTGGGFAGGLIPGTLVPAGLASALGVLLGTGSIFGGGAAGTSSLFSGLFSGSSWPSGAISYNSDLGQYNFPGGESGPIGLPGPSTTAGSYAMTGAGLAVGAYNAYKDFKQGGAAGDVKGVGALLGMAGLVSGPVVGPFLLAASAITTLVGSLLSTGPQQRELNIAKEIANNQYLAPTALNVTQGMNGTYEDFDSRGNLRTSTMSAIPTVTEPYIWRQTHGLLGGPPTFYNVPGGVTAPYSGGATGTGQAPVAGGTTVVINGGVSMIDASSFSDMVQRPEYSDAIGNSLASHLQRNEGRASNAIRFVSQQQ